MHADQPLFPISPETIYRTLYATLPSELRCELIAGLRWRRDKRRSKAHASDERRYIAEMQNIPLHPPVVADRLIMGHRGTNQIKCAMNRASVGALIILTSLMGVLAI